MKNEKYLVIEKEILEKLLKQMKDKRNFAGTDLFLKWLDGNVHALEIVLQYRKPLDETI